MKALVANWAGLDRDGLHVIVGLSLVLLSAIVVRRPFSHFLPWLIVLVACVIQEIFSAWLDDTLGLAIVKGSGRDVAIAMAAPTLILLAGRFVPDRPKVKRAASVRILLPISSASRPRGIDAIDVEFEEVPASEIGAQEFARLHAITSDR